jgi:hypothetical protein
MTIVVLIVTRHLRDTFPMVTVRHITGIKDCTYLQHLGLTLYLTVKQLGTTIAYTGDTDANVIGILWRRLSFRENLHHKWGYHRLDVHASIG